MSLKDLEKLIEPAPEGESTQRPVVVIIDDDPSIRSSLRSVLKDKYTVKLCVNGLEGVRAVDEQTACVILDVKMPVHDGFWVCKHLRKRDPDVPIIFHSGYQDLKDPYEIINEFRPFGFVVKGDTLSALLTIVANATRHSERVREGRRTVEQLREAREQLRKVYNSSKPPSRPEVPRKP